MKELVLVQVDGKGAGKSQTVGQAFYMLVEVHCQDMLDATQEDIPANTDITFFSICMSKQKMRLDDFHTCLPQLAIPKNINRKNKSQNRPNHTINNTNMQSHQLITTQ